MIPRKYHAIAFVSILVMLLLLGLHLLGFSLLGSAGGGQASSAAAAAALARNATTSTSSSSLLTPSGASSNSVYRHPIVYDKLTGATNNQINEVLGTSPKSTIDQYPIDHYQQQQQQQQQQHQAKLRNPFDQFANQDVAMDPFANMPGRQAFPPPPPPHGLGGPVSLRPPPPPPPPHHRPLVPSHNLVHHNHHPHQMMTTQAPQQQQQQRQQQQQQQQLQQDSLPSASSVNNNGAARPQANASNVAAQYYPNNQAQQPVYYTPPIFTYSNNNNNNNYDLAQQLQQPQVPPHGVPEVPLSVDEYNARQARLRQLEQLSNNDLQRQQQQQPNKADKQQVNLLADPEAQQRFKQQMLDRQLVFGGGGPAPVQQQQQQQYTNYEHPGGYLTGPQTLTDNSNNNFTSAAYYPDPALYGRLTGGQQQPPFRPPYAHQMSDPQQQQQQQQLEALKQMAPQNRIMAPPPSPQVTRPQATERQALQSAQLRHTPPPPSGASSIVRAGQAPPTRLTPTQDTQPSCARQQQQSVGALNSLELVNSTGHQSSQLGPVLYCNEDAEYPTAEVMRALESYAAERSVELLLPQPLVQLLTSSAGGGGGGAGSRLTSNQKMAELQRQLSLDSLQANINSQTAPDEQLGPGLFPSSSYEPMCKAATWMGQPRRAKNLLGQWKVIVNLPGHKYRGIAISQMVRMEECTRPNSECSSSSSSSSPSLSAASSPSPVGGATSATATKSQSSLVPAPALAPVPMLAKSRCLQLYDNQRLLAWSYQQGLHFDIFRMPSACTCHNRRF